MSTVVINDPLFKGFAFVACQIGASEYQVSAALAKYTKGLTPSQIREDNRDIGSILAFPYHDRRGGAATPSMDQVNELWREWLARHNNVSSSAAMSLNQFRRLIDPWMVYQWRVPAAGTGEVGADIP